MLIRFCPLYGLSVNTKAYLLTSYKQSDIVDVLLNNIETKAVVLLDGYYSLTIDHTHRKLLIRKLVHICIHVLVDPKFLRRVVSAVCLDPSKWTPVVLHTVCKTFTFHRWTALSPRHIVIFDLVYAYMHKARVEYEFSISELSLI